MNRFHIAIVRLRRYGTKFVMHKCEKSVEAMKFVEKSSKKKQTHTPPAVSCNYKK